MNAIKQYRTPILIAAVLGLFGLYVLGSAVGTDVPPEKLGGYDWATLRQVPIVDGGRLKPFDTLARTTLRLNSSAETVEDEDGKKYPAIMWLMEVISYDARSDSHTGLLWTIDTFKIDNDQIRNVLGLKGRPGLRYKLSELEDKLEILQKERDKASQVPKERRDLYQEKLLEFASRLSEFVRLNQLGFRGIPAETQGSEWASVGDRKTEHLEKAKQEAASRAYVKFGAHFDPNDPDFKKLPKEKQQELLQFQLGVFKSESDRLMREDVGLSPWMELIKAYRAKDVTRFNEIAASLAKNADQLNPKQQRALKLEVFFNRFAPLYKSIAMYVSAAILGLIGLLLTGWSRELSPPFRWASFSLIVMTLVLHTFGLAARMYIQGRPPVTNLYSSAVFIGFGAVLLCMVLEVIRPLGIANVVGATMGFLTTVIAHNLGSEGDTMEMMRAVLDTNFWLATHVTMVTLGYVATYVAGFLGILFILLGLFTPVLDRPTFKSLSGMIYGTVCFATFLSFVGTVLGGIWADYSWGRFWGWDPKENGALLIVLWNAVVLHARWGGLAKQRGVALLTVLGTIVTTWSWFGTNMLGVGLHSYGFSSLRLWAMVGFAAGMLGIVGIGLAFPLRYWSSNGEQFLTHRSI